MGGALSSEVGWNSSGPSAKELVRRSVSGPGERVLHRLPNTQIWDYELSPSRRWLALRQGQGVLLLSTRDARQLRLPLPGLKPAYGADEREFHWGPDENSLYYAKAIGPYDIEWREVRIRFQEG